jgi:hypothetical protein
MVSYFQQFYFHSTKASGGGSRMALEIVFSYEYSMDIPRLSYISLGL